MAPKLSMAKLWSFLAKISAILSATTLLKAEVKGLDISLISENSAISAGVPFTVGLHLKHNPGYHTYWENPGIVGMATSLKWKLPEGFTAAEIQWPFPERSDMAGHPCHGYERDVTLMVTITPPQKIRPQPVTLSASAQWMCCAKNCHPGFQDFILTLPVADQAQLNPKTNPLFIKARSELPLHAKDFPVTLLSKANAAKIELITPSTKAKKIYFFSEDGQVSSDQLQKITAYKEGKRKLTLTRSEFSPEDQPALPGVLQLGSKFYRISPKYLEK